MDITQIYLRQCYKKYDTVSSALVLQVWVLHKYISYQDLQVIVIDPNSEKLQKLQKELAEKVKNAMINVCNKRAYIMKM